MNKDASTQGSLQSGQRSAPDRIRSLSRRKRTGFIILLIVLILLFAEGVCGLALRLTEGVWPWSRPRTANFLLFEPHPDWVITPRKHTSITVLGVSHSHNPEGFRGPAFNPATAKPRIACVGGSTTYGIGIGDNETWPFLLNQLLQPRYDVLNFGIPGHSSVEHAKLLPVVLAKYHPNVVALQMGLNDLHNMNVKDLGPGYANFHKPALEFSASGATRRDKLPPSALLHGSVVLLERMKILGDSPFPHGLPAGNLSDSVDPVVLDIFSAQLDSMLRECASNSVRVLLIPQTMSEETITEDNYKWWAPYLTKQGIFNALEALNKIMRDRADGKLVLYATFLDHEAWTPSEFCDPSHLNGQGNQRLAGLLAENVPWDDLSSQGVKGTH